MHPCDAKLDRVLLFGDATQWQLVWLLAGVLVAVLCFNVLAE
jgi:hypothetical protein